MKHDNKPLTLEELRQMDGQPVWIASINPLISQWAIVEYGDIDNVISFQDSKNELNLLVSWYGKAWLAYAYKPIDFDEWEPCELCKRLGEADPCYKDGCFRENAPQCDYRCDKFLAWRTVQRRLNKAKFCPECGRPLTAAARQMLENRLMGVTT